MDWIITNGKVYIAKGAANTVHTTSSQDSALRFQDRKKVDNFCSNLPKSFKNLCFYPQPVQAAETTEVAPAPVVIAEPNKIAVLNEDILDADAFVSKIQDFQQFLRVVKEQRPLLAEAQKKVEREIIDIEHAAEFNTYNAAQGYMLFRRLRDARLRRRQYKDAQVRIDILMDCDPMSVASSNAVQRIRGMENRKYTPLECPELFAE